MNATSRGARGAMVQGTERGAGDRWLAGEAVDGVRYGHHAAVAVTAGRHAGARGRIALLLSLGDDPLYLVLLADGQGEARVRQSALRPLA